MDNEFAATFAEGQTPPATNPADALREAREQAEQQASTEFGDAWNEDTQ